nr:7437_t:CDS:1 [Entrophospora candida]
MSQQQQILDKQLQNYYYDGHSVRQFQQVQHSQVQNSEQRQIYAQQINNPTQQIFQQQIQQTQQTLNIDQEIIPFDNSLSIIATSPPFQKVTSINNNNDMLSAQSLPQQPHQLVYVKGSSHTSSSPSTNNDISNNCHQYNRDLNLNVSTLNCGNNNEDLFAAISYHMSMIKDHRMKISQHHFELEQIINMLRHRNNQDRK